MKMLRPGATPAAQRVMIFRRPPPGDPALPLRRHRFCRIAPLSLNQTGGNVVRFHK